MKSLLKQHGLKSIVENGTVEEDRIHLKGISALHHLSEATTSFFFSLLRVHTMSQHSGFSLLDQHLSALPASLREHILQRLRHSLCYQPVIGIMGKTGAGKSSLCNGLFNGECCAVSDVDACTREPQRLTLTVGAHTLTLMDLPGVGESQERDAEYEALYQRLLPELDLILWVIRADDRALAADEHVYHQILKASHTPHPAILFVLSQADKVDPSLTWDSVSQQPSRQQQDTLQRKINAVAAGFQVSPAHVIAISAITGYQMPSLVEAMIYALPRYASSHVYAHINASCRTEIAVDKAKEDFGDTVTEIVDWAIGSVPVPNALKALVQSVKTTIKQVARAVWGWFFG